MAWSAPGSTTTGSDETAKVHTKIRQPDGPPVPVDYLLEHGSDGWKIFDVVIAGASLLTNYRGTFTQQINMGGIDGLIKSLEAKGRDCSQLAGKPARPGGAGRGVGSATNLA